MPELPPESWSIEVDDEDLSLGVKPILHLSRSRSWSMDDNDENRGSRSACVLHNRHHATAPHSEELVR